ncbi:MAG: NAD(+) synthase [Clostridia bacterium]|nr:NAD(+) synthase [Clostridia bacterium]
MKHGFIKCACLTPEIRLADCKSNAKEIISLIKEASASGVRLALLPELCITGATCGDLFFQEKLISAAQEALSDIAEGTRRANTVFAAGLPFAFEGKLYNCSAVVYKGKILGLVPSANANRYFAPAPDETFEIDLFGKTTLFGTDILFKCAELPEFSFAAVTGGDFGIYALSEIHAAEGANIILNSAADPETVGKAEIRRNAVKTASKKLISGYMYSNAGDGESTTDAVYAGHAIIGENGTVLVETAPFEKAPAITDIDVKMIDGERKKAYYPESTGEYAVSLFEMELSDTPLTRKYEKYPFIPELAGCEDILKIQAAGLEKRLSRSNSKTAVIGISGGLDSTLALIVCVRAFYNLGWDKKNIIAVTMPCFGTTERTKGNAEKLCEALGVTLKCVDISESVTKHIEDIGHDINNHNAVYENAQARERTQVLMDIANMEGGIVIGTGDMSELALGWATYNGDHMSMYGVNCGVPKTLVRYLVKYVADVSQGELKDVLIDILDTPVSPELLPPEEGDIAQKTEDIVGPYELHDFFMYYATKYAFEPKKIYRLAADTFDGEYEAETILKWLKTFYRRFFTQQFKRSCVPDGPKVGEISLSPRTDLKMPSDAAVALWLSELE